MVPWCTAPLLQGACSSASHFSSLPHSSHSPWPLFSPVHCGLWILNFCLTVAGFSSKNPCYTLPVLQLLLIKVKHRWKNCSGPTGNSAKSYKHSIAIVASCLPQLQPWERWEEHPNVMGTSWDRPALIPPAHIASHSPHARKERDPVKEMGRCQAA